MRCEDLFVAGVASWLPPAVPVEDAVADGRYDAEVAEGNGYLSIAVAGADDPPPEMAARAGRRALDRSGVRPEDVALLAHACSWYQGVDFWPAASYVHRRVLGAGGRWALALDVQQMSNGVAALELAAGYLAADPARGAAMVTCADRFAAPGFDRWRSDRMNIVWGDGAAAAVLARGTGVARLLSVGTAADSRLEEQYRAGEEFGAVPGHAGFPVDLRGRRKAYRAMEDQDRFVARAGAGLAAAARRTLDDAGLRPAELARVVFPNATLRTLRAHYLAPLGLDIAVTTWPWGRRTGHLGTADQLAGLADLIERGEVGAGDRIMLVGIGVGFAWSCAVLEMVGDQAS